MNEYRVLVKKVEYRHIWVNAENPAAARKAAMKGNYNDSSSLPRTTEVVSIDDLGAL